MATLAVEGAPSDARSLVEDWEDLRAWLMTVVTPRVNDRALAEDLVHGVLLKSFERSSQLRDPARARAWIHRMALNAVHDHFRRRRAMVALPESLEAVEVDGDAELRSEVSRCLPPLVRTLPPIYREILELTERDGLTQREAATLLGLSLTGAKSRAQRAKAMLRERLMQSCAPELDARGGVTAYHPSPGFVEEPREFRPGSDRLG